MSVVLTEISFHVPMETTDYFLRHMVQEESALALTSPFQELRMHNFVLLCDDTGSSLFGNLMVAISPRRLSWKTEIPEFSPKTSSWTINPELAVTKTHHKSHHHL